jgi:hypothetical protein
VVDVGFKGSLEAVEGAGVEIGGAPGRVAEKHKLDREACRVPVISARAAGRVSCRYEVEVVCRNGGQRVRKERGSSPQGRGVGVLVVHRQDADGQEGGVGASALLGREGPVHRFGEGIPVIFRVEHARPSCPRARVGVIGRPEDGILLESGEVGMAVGIAVQWAGEQLSGGGAKLPEGVVDGGRHRPVVGELHLATHAHAAAVLIAVEERHQLGKEASVRDGWSRLLVPFPEELQTRWGDAASQAASSIVHMARAIMGVDAWLRRGPNVGLGVHRAGRGDDRGALGVRQLRRGQGMAQGGREGEVVGVDACRHRRDLTGQAGVKRVPVTDRGLVLGEQKGRGAASAVNQHPAHPPASGLR